MDQKGQITGKQYTIEEKVRAIKLYESNFMQVQALLPASNSKNPNLTPVGDGFRFIHFYAYPNFNSKKDKLY